MNIIKISNVDSRPFWPRIASRFRKHRKMSPEQWAARAKQLGIDGEPATGPRAVKTTSRKAA